MYSLLAHLLLPESAVFIQHDLRSVSQDHMLTVLPSATIVIIDMETKILCSFSADSEHCRTDAIAGQLRKEKTKSNGTR